MDTTLSYKVSNCTSESSTLVAISKQVIDGIIFAVCCHRTSRNRSDRGGVRVVPEAFVSPNHDDHDGWSFVEVLLATVHSVRFDCGLPQHVPGMSAGLGNHSTDWGIGSGTRTVIERLHPHFEDAHARHAAWANAGCVIYYYDAKWDTNLTFVTHLMSAWGTEPIGAVLLVTRGLVPVLHWPTGGRGACVMFAGFTLKCVLAVRCHWHRQDITGTCNRSLIPICFPIRRTGTR